MIFVLRLRAGPIQLSSILCSETDNTIRRYYIRMSFNRVVKQRDFWVHSYRMPPEANSGIKMEVGIEDCLHIEFEYNKAK